METTTCTERLPGVAGDVERAPYIEALRRYLTERRPAGNAVRSYAKCAGHFLRWSQEEPG